MRSVKTAYSTDILIGTNQDDGRVSADCLFIRPSEDRRQMRVLTKEQALELVTALLATVQELE